MEEMRSVLDPKKSAIEMLKATWYFEKSYEKIIMVGLGILGVWKIFGWFI